MFSKITVNMKALSITKEPIESEYLELGGRGLIAQYLMKNVPPACDPLGDENRLLFCTSLFAGTRLTTGNRLSLGGKSPLTGGIKESNVGGAGGGRLADYGIRMIVVEQKPVVDGLWILHIQSDGTPELLDASDFRGLDNYAFAAKAREEFSDDAVTISIGSAGEREYRAASVQVSEFGSGHPSRAAARGGLGALMGSKGLKAIVIDKAKSPVKPDYTDEERFNTACVKLNKLVAGGAKNDPFHNVGTVATMDVAGANGVLPVENFSGKLFKDYEKVASEAFLGKLSSRGGRNKIACQAGCLVRCSNSYNDEKGEYVTSGFEYETIALFGPNCRISDLDKIARMDRICDDVGVDTIDIANGIAMCMEAGKIPWGDADAALMLLEEMKRGTEFGRLLGNGCEAVGRELGCERIPVVKHQALPGYDPRNTKGTGVTYATSPMGADHTAGLTLGRAFDDCGRAAQAYASNKLQVAITIADSTMCLFAFSHMVPGLPLLGELMAALYGGEADFNRLATMAVKTVLTERGFNKMAGLTDADDKLPQFFYDERSEATGSRFDIPEKELEVIFDF